MYKKSRLSPLGTSEKSNNCQKWLNLIDASRELYILRANLCPVVNGETTIDDIYWHLQNLGVVCIFFSIVTPVLNPCLLLEGLRKDYATIQTLGRFGKGQGQSADYNSHYANTNPVMSPEEQLTGSPVKFNIFGRYTPQDDSADNSNELAEYFRLTNIPPSFEDTGPLKWWYTCHKKFPNLYLLAQDMLCIPGNVL
jgi:hypothetical protein